MAALGREWTPPLLRCAHEQRGVATVPSSGRQALASDAVATQSKGTCPLEPNAASDRPLAASCARVSSLSSAPTWRYHLREEPDAGNPLVRIRGGGYEQS
jgi:hypothetical protein